MKDQKKLNKLTKKWASAKAALQEAQALELSIRNSLDELLAKNELLVVKVETVTDAMTFKRNHNYSIPKAAITDIKANLPEATFNDAFTTSYKLKPAVYENLSGECREAIEKHLVIKPSPLSVSVKPL